MLPIEQNLERVRDRIAHAASKSGRNPDDITIVAVTKTFGADMVDAVIEAGIADIGENRVQEFIAKSPDVRRECRWHLIGPLQSNKATKAIGRFHLVHSIDSVKIAQTLSRLGEERGIVTRALIQVNTSAEPGKHGFGPPETVAAVAQIAALPALDVGGLMTIGPYSQVAADTRRCFAELRELRDRAVGETGHGLHELSMGMSGDFEAAIEEGATIIRLGRILTGDRPAR